MPPSEKNAPETEKLPEPVEPLLQDDKKIHNPVLVHTESKNLRWNWRRDVPYGILAVSLLEIVFYAISDDKLQKLLRFEPNKLKEIWRFVTYMFLHEDWIHLLLNIFMQVLFAYFLEIRHGRTRVFILYITGGITGVLGACCFHPDLVIGASGGVYALLISHVSDILMNFENLNYKLYRSICIVIIVLSDIAYNIIHAFFKKEPLISWGAHMIGGMSGLFLGLVLFKQEASVARTRKVSLFWLGLILYIILMISLVLITMQIKKCTPKDTIKSRYVYFC